MKIIIRCAYCAADTETVVRTPDMAVAAMGTTPKPFYCRICNRLNIVTLPDTWDVTNPVLDSDVLVGYKNGLPVVQGQRA